VYNNRIPLADKCEQVFQLWPLNSLTRGLVGEDTIYLHLFDLPVWILINAANAHIANPLS
jgi:hypothetical protein